MRRILIGYVIGSNSCGIDSYLFPLIQSLREWGIQVDLLTNEKNENLSQFAETHECNLLEIPSLKHLGARRRAIRELLEAQHYDMAYFNISEAFNCVDVLEAKACGVERVLVHSHASGPDEESRIKWLIKYVIHVFAKHVLLRGKATDLLACSEKSAKWLYTQSDRKRLGVTMVSNAVDAKRYAYDEQVRAEMRTKLEIGDRFVLGHVSGFTPVKNIGFLLRVLEEAKKTDISEKTNRRPCLLLVGDGIEMESVRAQVEELHLQEDVIFTGRRTDVPDLLQAMDVFVFPSFREGLGFVAIEAQMSGLPVLASDGIPQEVQLSERCEFMSLKEGPKAWAKHLMEMVIPNRSAIDFEKSPYNLTEQKKELQRLFTNSRE